MIVAMKGSRRKANKKVKRLLEMAGGNAEGFRLKEA